MQTERGVDAGAAPPARVAVQSRGVARVARRFSRRVESSRGLMRELYEFGGFRLDPLRRVLFGADGQPIALKSKVFDTLLYLVEHAGESLEKSAMMAAIWPNLVVEESNLNKNISVLRRALGEASRRAPIHRDRARTRLPFRRQSRRRRDGLVRRVAARCRADAASAQGVLVRRSPAFIARPRRRRDHVAVNLRRARHPRRGRTFGSRSKRRGR